MLHLVADPVALDFDNFRDKRAHPERMSRTVAEPFELRDRKGVLRVALHSVDPEQLATLRESLGRVKFKRSDRSEGMWSYSCIFGFMPRITGRLDFCRCSTLAAENPIEHGDMVDCARLAARYYRVANPEMYAHQLATVNEHVLADYILRGTPYTSGIANRTNPLHFHRDAGNFPGFWSTMFVLRDRVDGGQLVMPAYDLAVDIPDSSVFMFDGQSIIHGVAPIVKHHPRAYRYSVVYYSLRNLQHCLPIAEEFKRARTRRDEVERNPRTADAVGRVVKSSKP